MGRTRWWGVGAQKVGDTARALWLSRLRCGRRERRILDDRAMQKLQLPARNGGDALSGDKDTGKIEWVGGGNRDRGLVRAESRLFARGA